ncbi:MAG TPA: twin-arginine translocase subunit TatC [Candidatus Polarisedimenticolaceae bacterium]|nr:twin-arginine translocase subunit TatC [Candidatus Polarisedimenticolaceae bacterium]
MSFLEHLDELRSRLFRVALVFVVLLAGCWLVSDKILRFLLRPIREHLFGGGDIVFLALTEPFMVYMKASAVAALFLAMPYVLWQLWGFVAPGLYPGERRAGALFIMLGTLFFAAGGAFGYYVAIPVTARWLLSLGSQFKAQLTLQSAFEFESRLLLGAGLVFEMPVVILVLARFGIVTPSFLMRHFRLAVMIIAITAAVVTPSGDALTMSLFALPMIGLYLLGVGFAWIAARKAAAPRSAR